MMAQFTLEELAAPAAPSLEDELVGTEFRLAKARETQDPAAIARESHNLAVIKATLRGEVPPKPAAEPATFSLADLTKEAEPYRAMRPLRRRPDPMTAFMKDVEKPAPTPREPMTGLERTGQVMSNVLGLADMVLSTPAFAMGMGADVGARLTGIAAGQGGREVGQSGLRANERVMEIFGNPLQKLMRAAGLGPAYESSDVSKGMSWLSEQAQRTGGMIEEATKGAVTSEDYQSMFNIAMGAAPFASTKANPALAGPRRAPPPPREQTIQQVLDKEKQLDQIISRSEEPSTPVERDLGGTAYEIGSRPKVERSRTTQEIISGERKVASEIPSQRTADEMLAAREKRFAEERYAGRGIQPGDAAAGAAALGLGAYALAEEDPDAAMAAAGLPLAARTRGAFFTKPGVARSFADWVKARPEFAGIKEVIEPSAGRGDILRHFEGARGFDIEPMGKGIEQADFLKKDLGYRPGRAFVGNPPFGTRGKDAVAFLDKALREGDYAAFIGPPTLKSLARGVKGELIAEADLPGSRNFYYPGAKDPENIRATAQIWKRSELPWEPKQAAGPLAGESADIYVPRTSYRGNTTARSAVPEGMQREHFIAVKASPKEQQRLQEFDWSQAQRYGRGAVTRVDVQAVMEGRNPFVREVLRESPAVVAGTDAGKAALAAGGLAGLAALMDEDTQGADTLAPGLAMAAAVKGKGGNWLEGTLKRVNPFADKAERPRMDRETTLPINPVDASMDRMADRYFKTFFGSEADPLKDVKIPTADITWSDAAAHVIADITAGEAAKKMLTVAKQREPWLLKVPEDTVLHYIRETKRDEFGRALDPVGDWAAVNSTTSIKDYLRHVADYLRQNVISDEAWHRSPEWRKLAEDDLRIPANTESVAQELARETTAKAAFQQRVLQQYDLPRAVKETVKWDEELAKKMEQERAAETSKLPVHKAYEDGYKWVELKMPEEPASNFVIKRVEDGWIVNDALKGEGVNLGGVRDRYRTQEAAQEAARRETLARQLQREGDAMGHCVGGYCAGVEAGESRIFSLRDPKGNPHVTIEVEPGAIKKLFPHVQVNEIEPGTWRAIDREPGGRIREAIDVKAATKEEAADAIAKSGHPAFTEWSYNQSVPETIAQIKGKQNRAPDAKYLPYVQDFVKSGNWADVWDLQNAGMERLGSEGQQRFVTRREKLESDIKTLQEALAEARSKDEPNVPGKEEALAGGDDLISRWQAELDKLPPEVQLPRSQRGSIDPQLAKSVAMIGGGAALMAVMDPGDNNVAEGLRGAVLGAMLNFATTKNNRAMIDKAVGLISTRIQEISPALHQRMVEFEAGLARRLTGLKEQVDPFLVQLNALPRAQQSEMTRAALTGNAEAIAQTLANIGDAKFTEAWLKVRETLTGIGSQLRETGMLTRTIPDYFPRIVKDREGLMAALGSESRTIIEEKLAAAKIKAGRDLSQLEESKIINDYLLAPLREGNQPGWAKGRKVQEITAELEPFYMNLTDSLHSYVRSAAMELEKDKLFGKDAHKTDYGGQQHIDDQRSIGNLVLDLQRREGLTNGQTSELKQMLEARFGPGERMSNTHLQRWRNMTNALLLGNPLSAAVQLGDIAPTVYLRGLMPTLEAVQMVLTGNANIRPKDIGLVNHISEEFVSSSRTAKILQAALKYSGFSSVDAFGKTINLQATRLQLEKLAQTERGRAELKAQYEPAYGERVDSVIQDLRDRKLNEQTLDLYFGELSRAQPINKLETPQMYLENPNGRTLYQLKSFMLKQADLARREAYNKIKNEGTRAEGLKNLALLATALGVSGAGPDMLKDFLMGRPFDGKWSDIPLNALKTFGLTEYVLDKAVGRGGGWSGKGSIPEAAAQIAIPPYKMFDEILRGDPAAIKYIPVIGKALYEQEYTQAGKERGEKKREAKKLREVNKRLMPWFGTKPSDEVREEIRAQRELVREMSR